MPNYVTSRCVVSGPTEDIARFEATAFRIAPEGHSDAGGTLFDFNAIIPMPAVLDGCEESSDAELGVALIIYRGGREAPFADRYEYWSNRVRAAVSMPEDSISDVAAAFLAAHPDIEAKGRARLTAILETGFASWYPWCLANWGTKWGAFRFSRLDEPGLAFRFETAWSFPIPVFEKLAAEFPTLSFGCLTFDEGWNFAGEGWFNPPVGAAPFQIVGATNELYERVYGQPAPVEDADSETCSD